MFVIFSAATAVGDAFRAPYLGNYVPPGWRRATFVEAGLHVGEHGVLGGGGEPPLLFVDGSGYGRESEPALTHRALAEVLGRALESSKTIGSLGVGIVLAGQFQVHLGLYVKPRLQVVK